VAVPRTGTGAARGIEIGLKIDVQRAGSCWGARQAEEAGGGRRAETMKHMPTDQMAADGRVTFGVHIDDLM